ncbi:MAG: hypothetical protein DWQ37_11400 [Planctomycetota bacterium]|nr:MAG: hypothetical protein DWQ37_11400 [Planctomycetota bacterium]
MAAILVAALRASLARLDQVVVIDRFHAFKAVVIVAVDANRNPAHRLKAQLLLTVPLAVTLLAIILPLPVALLLAVILPLPVALLLV